MGNATHINAPELRTLLSERRIALGLSVRQAACAAGVPHTTLSRVLRGESVPDRDNLVLLLKWIDKPLEQLTFGLDDDSDTTLELTTSELVARILLADKELTPEEVDVLMVLFHAGYNLVLKRKRSKRRATRKRHPSGQTRRAPSQRPSPEASQ